MASIKLFRGEFGHVSVLNAASDLVTHAHPEAHIIIWLGGDAGEITVGGVRVAPAHDRAVGVNAFEPHSHSFSPSAAPGLFLAFYIDPHWADRCRGLRPTGRLFSYPSFGLDAWLRAAAVGLFERLDGGCGDDDLTACEIERLIDRLLDAARPRSMPRKRAGGRSIYLDFRVRKAVEIMRSDVSGRMNFDELARNVGLSRPHFFALFREQMNLTPNVFWNTLRMEEALRQLGTSGESLTAVACNLGFTTQSNFTRFFRDHAGVPPMIYREAARTAA